MSDFSEKDTELNLRGLDRVERTQIQEALYRVAQDLADTASKVSGHTYVAVPSGSRTFPRAAVFPVGVYAKRSENKHHWLNRVLP